MSQLSKLNQPITFFKKSENIISSTRPFTPQEEQQLKAEIDRISNHHQTGTINFRLILGMLIIYSFLYLVTRSSALSSVITSFAILFVFLLPLIAQKEKEYLKNDLKGGLAMIKTGPISIIEEDFRGSYSKRYYLDDVIVDGIYSRNDSVKYPELKNGQTVTVTYSPKAQMIFSVV